MGMVVYLNGPETREDARNASGPMRQRGISPVSQCVKLGDVIDNLLERLESQMNETAITKP